MALWWPSTLSFIDEAGHLGQARQLLTGTVGFEPGAPGYWVSNPPVAKYPLPFSALLAPLVAVHPALGFALPMAAVLAAVALLAWLLRREDVPALWALVLLAHPTFVILARTAMPDTLLCAAVLAAWVAAKAGRRGPLVGALALMCTLKPTGIILAAGFAVGEALSRRSRYVALIAGLAIGLLVVAGTNWLTTDGVFYGYEHGVGASFDLRRLATTGGVHLVGLLLTPPGLILGAVVLWRRREFGALCAAGALLVAMSTYFWADWGIDWIETLVLAPRLVLPAHAILLVGWLIGLHGLVGIRPAFALPLAAIAVTVVIAWKHAAWQAPAAEVRERAEGHAGDTLGYTFEASKAAMLSTKRLVLVDTATGKPSVVLRADAMPSRRAGYSQGSVTFTLSR